MNSVKKLLVFAHKGEADFFITNLNLQVVKDFSSFYQGDDYYLLLISEDSTYLIYALTSILTRFQHTISEVINLGISGTVQDEIAIGSFHSIKNVYCYQKNQFHKKSYSLSSPTPQTLDVMTLDVTLSKQKKLREEVSYFASLVDKELWYIAWVCEKLNKPLSAYKLVSDQAKKIAIDNIIGQKQKYAESLWQKFKENFISLSSKQDNSINKLKIKIEKFLDKEFYFTNQQKLQLTEILLKQKALNQLKVFYRYMLLSHQTAAIPKQKTQKLLNLLNSDTFREKMHESFLDLLPVVMKKAMKKKQFTCRLLVLKRLNFE